ncbi:Laminin subunit beta-1 [Bagarius yarrelli]|uniref:Laminin subunit beta-1 n=1 Tax=Bagarius yarrelli TaxID=175774 RepID=A0A556U3M2_BAGYA|nr:Laminin subunit beta-1 [Bagarius yarrelli]
MSEVSLSELLDLSIYPPSEGISNVNYTALRKLLQCIVQRLDADGDVVKAVLGKTFDDRDVDESQLDEKDSESLEQQNAKLGEPPSGTTSSSDTTRGEGVPKSITSLIQDLLKKNQELEERTNTQKLEMEILQKQLSQSASLMQDLIHKNLELKEETNKLREEMETLQDQLEQSMSTMQELSNENQDLKEETNNIKKNMGTLQNPSLVQDLINDNQELKEKTNNLRKEMDTLNNKFSQVYEMEVLDSESSRLDKELDTSKTSARESIDGESELQQSTQLPRNAVQQLYIEVQNIKQELQVFFLEQKDTSEKDIQNKFTQLTVDVQRNIQQLQSEFEKLQKNIMEDSIQEQTHIENLGKSIKDVEEKVETKADMQTVETTVATTTQQLTGMFQDLLNSTTDFEENHNTVTEKIFRELKMSQAEIDRLRKLIEILQKAQSEEIDNAAIVKKSMTSTNLSQSARSSTERSIKQTRKGESCVSDGLINIGTFQTFTNTSISVHNQCY